MAEQKHVDMSWSVGRVQSDKKKDVYDLVTLRIAVTGGAISIILTPEQADHLVKAIGEASDSAKVASFKAKVEVL